QDETKSTPTITSLYRTQFTAYGETLERVEVFKYLGRLMAMDDNDMHAVRHNLKKARGGLEEVLGPSAWGGSSAQGLWDVLQSRYPIDFALWQRDLVVV
ncbi:hypothetical protein THAOC_06156, partial [Thalassiosira oceanica]